MGTNACNYHMPRIPQDRQGPWRTSSHAQLPTTSGTRTGSTQSCHLNAPQYITQPCMAAWWWLMVIARRYTHVKSHAASQVSIGIATSQVNFQQQHAVCQVLMSPDPPADNPGHQRQACNTGHATAPFYKFRQTHCKPLHSISHQASLLICCSNQCRQPMQAATHIPIALPQPSPCSTGCAAVAKRLWQTPTNPYVSIEQQVLLWQPPTKKPLRELSPAQWP
jgi:hypothetical protein